MWSTAQRPGYMGLLDNELHVYGVDKIAGSSDVRI